MIGVRRVLVAAAAALLMAAAPAMMWAQNTQPPAQDSKTKAEEAGKLVAVLQAADAPLFDKAKACQRLASIGTKQAVPALAALLSDEKLAHYARFGLEAIPDPAVDGALRDAMGKLKGRLLVGVLNSIGVRRDAQAADGLAKLLGDSDAEVAAAAAAALGRIGNSQAAATLQQALAGGAMPVRAAVADACLTCADVLAAQGKRDEAVALFDAVRKADLPKHLRVAATRGAIIARQSAGLPLLVEQLKADDKAMFGVALGTARELTGAGVTQALVAELDKLPPPRQALLIQALGDRGDVAALPAVLQAAKSGSPQVRLAAIRVLPRVGNATAVAVLLAAATQADEELAQAAQAGLIQLRGNEVDAALVAMLGQGDSRTRRVVIDSVGQRRAVSAVPTLWKAADDPNQDIRVAAVKALGETIGLADLAVLTGRLLKPKTDQDKAAAQEALKAACARMPDRDACTQKLLEGMPQASVASKCILLDLLGSVGGAKALKAVSLSARDPNDEIQDAATRILGEWMNADAAPELLALARSAPNSKYKLRALRGYIRIAKQLDMPAAQRLAMCQTAMATATRDDEKKLVLQVLGLNASAEALKTIVPHLGNPSLKEPAGAAAVAIAEKLIKTNPAAVAEAMSQVLQAGASGDVADRAKALSDQAKRKAKRKQQ